LALLLWLIRGRHNHIIPRGKTKTGRDLDKLAFNPVQRIMEMEKIIQKARAQMVMCMNRGDELGCNELIYLFSRLKVLLIKFINVF
jgi:hypothetical protein